MKSNLTLLYLFLFVYFVSLFVAGDWAPVEDIALACGSNSTFQYQDYYYYDGGRYRSWTGDIDSRFLPIVGSSAHRMAPDNQRPPYDNARLSYSEFTYRFYLTPGQKFVRLYFYTVSYTDFNRSKALFSVKAGDLTLVDDFNASAIADAAGEDALYREFCLNIDEQQSLRPVNITFTPIKDAYAFINGIEIVPMPTSLYYSAPESAGIQYVGGGQLTYRIENSTPLETLYRLDIGKLFSHIYGDRTYDDYDLKQSDMYRSWDADDVYLDGFSKEFSVTSYNDTIPLNFVTIPVYSAPESVYRSGRSMGMNNTINKSHNLTWKFPVDSSFHYLVRLHFCEFESDITRSGDRKFQIELANHTVEEGADIIQWSGGEGIPVYRDYIVHMFSPENEKKVNLSLSLAAFQKDGVTSHNDAILNGLEILKLLDSNTSFNAGPQVKIPKRKNKSTPALVVVAGVVASILVFSDVIGFLVFRRGWRVKDSGSSHRMKNSMKTHKSSLPTHLCRYFSSAVIKVATENFNVTSIIGVGGFGNVYKGWIDGGETVVAIKRLKPDSSQGALEFKTEIELLSQIRHRHLVSLIGYCNDKGEMILVYDYMARGTLCEHLYNTDNPPLPWKQRLEICIGAARGLQYLHSGVKGTIIHRDVKSTNILLDEKWVAKVSDFGLSKMGTPNMSKTHISTLVKGSFGYLDPEYYRTQHLTEKSDVYSLGVVLCEVLCARPAVIPTEAIRQASLAEWTKNCHQNGELDQIIDPRLRGKIAAECLNKFIEVAISCMHDYGTERPSMAEVVRGLELALQLQQSAEGNINCTEKNVETETSSSEQCCVTNDSIKCISATIFSDINNSSGR